MKSTMICRDTYLHSPIDDLHFDGNEW